MTRALITGCTGGLGANLAAALVERGVEVVGLRRSTSPGAAVDDLELAFCTGDILDPASLRQAMDGVDWVFHAAAIADDWHHPRERIYEVNVEGTRNVLAAALEAGVRRFVYTGSSAALGKPSPGKPLMDEADSFNLDPADFPYGHSKHLAEQVVAEFVTRGLDAVSVLPTALMGPRDLNFISGELLVRVVKRQLMPFPRGGLNYADLRDVAAGHVAAAEQGRTGERYILGGHNLTHREALQIIAAVANTPARAVTLPHWLLPVAADLVSLGQRLGFRMPIERGRVLLSGEFMYYDSSKARRELGLEARPFAESVRDAYDWYRARGWFARRGIHLEPPPPEPD